MNTIRLSILSAILMWSVFTFGRAKSTSTSYLARNYTITASAGEGGIISPSGEVEVKRDRSQTFEIEANTGYDILDVLVDGESQGAVSSYIFSKVKSDHTITATFSLKQFTISATAGTGGEIYPSGEVSVPQGDDQAFSISAETGYSILDVLIDGSSLGPVANYTFSAVSSNHSISATFVEAAWIQNISIPNVSMKIDDVITATITVDDDGGVSYTFLSGSVGGYPMTGFQRLSAASYEAEIHIIEGGSSFSASEEIPVSNLVISKGEAQSASYNNPIVQNNDPIDAELPVISSMMVEGGTKKIGDVVILNIVADGVNYTAHPLTTINGKFVTATNVSFTESGGGAYRLSYTIQEGDSDVIPGTIDLEASVILVKPSDNTSLPYSTISNASELFIDANAPVADRMEVPSMPVGVGGTVKVLVTTDGIGYSMAPGTVINGVPISSSRVTFNELSDGLYEISYVVAVEDAAAAPGTLQVSIELRDPAGNVGTTYEMLEPNNLEIYTDLPEATLEGAAEICEGVEVELSVSLSGRPPWSFVLKNDTSNTYYSDISYPDYKIIVAPVQTAIYQISSVTDVNGVENTNSGNVQIKVIPRTDVEIINLSSGYKVDADPVLLEANVPGGIFTGPGVNSATEFFYPALADTVDSPHTIFYHYMNESGCSSSDSNLVYVFATNGDIIIPGNTICGNADPFIVRGWNVAGATGFFRLLNSASQPVPGLLDHGDNTASIDPAFLIPEDYIIEYQYLDEVVFDIRKAFSVENINLPQILNLNESSYCQDVTPFVLQSNLSDVVFEGPGVSGNKNEGFILNPSEIEPGMIFIHCTYISENGCVSSTEKSINIDITPEVKFGLSSTCDPEEGEFVSFDNQTGGKSSVETWSWYFDDLSSGQNNHSNLMEPTHFYEEPGQRSISLAATTFEGCVATVVKDTVIDSKPVVDFTWISECFPTESGTQFVNRTNFRSTSVDTIIWTFKTSEGDVLEKVGSISITDTVEYQFPVADSYQVELYTMNSGGCYNEITKDIILQPTIKLDGDGYSENFDGSEGLWIKGSENNVESWVWDVPDFTGYVPVPGDLAWFTRLPSGVSDYQEDSWIQSPCFDFSGVDRPLIQMDIMRSFVPNLNGAVLQYKDVVEEGWKTLGEQTPGKEWYNVDYIINKPGGSKIGWGLYEFNPDTEWVTAIHDLDQVNGNPGVAFRVVIATNGDQGMGNQGFAFDNVVIAKRSKIAVLEHFTDNSDDSSRIADDIIDAFINLHSKDVIDLQYHLNDDGLDPMYLNNPLPSSTRWFNYDFPPIPFSAFDGGTSLHLRYNFSKLKATPMEDHLRLLTLEIPKFEIDLYVDWMESGLEAKTTVTCLADQFEEYIGLYLVVLETSVTSYTGSNGDTYFRNVVLDMLPLPSGKLLGDNWYKGMSDFRSNTWDYQPYVEDINDLAVAAFVMDRSTGQILQATVEYKDKTVGVLKPVTDIGKLKIYPNPAYNTVYIDFGTHTENRGRIELMDMTGKVVLEERVPVKSQIIQLDIEHLESGMYIFHWTDSEQVRGVSKVVKTR